MSFTLDDINWTFEPMANGDDEVVGFLGHYTGTHGSHTIIRVAWFERTQDGWAMWGWHEHSIAEAMAYLIDHYDEPDLFARASIWGTVDLTEAGDPPASPVQLLNGFSEYDPFAALAGAVPPEIAEGFIDLGAVATPELLAMIHVGACDAAALEVFLDNAATDVPPHSSALLLAIDADTGCAVLVDPEEQGPEWGLLCWPSTRKWQGPTHTGPWSAPTHSGGQWCQYTRTHCNWEATITITFRCDSTITQPQWVCGNEVVLLPVNADGTCPLSP
ncbi:MAG: hypothetical protein EA379_03630 [Phycisphaerales bacterium]|nr:MAG: hypothetical protein EA379_03630 [Phycisphaerales bacterium]